MQWIQATRHDATRSKIRNSAAFGERKKKGKKKDKENKGGKRNSTKEKAAYLRPVRILRGQTRATIPREDSKWASTGKQTGKHRGAGCAEQRRGPTPVSQRSSRPGVFFNPNLTFFTFPYSLLAISEPISLIIIRFPFRYFGRSYS